MTGGRVMTDALEKPKTITTIATTQAKPSVRDRLKGMFSITQTSVKPGRENTFFQCDPDVLAPIFHKAKSTMEDAIRSEDYGLCQQAVNWFKQAAYYAPARSYFVNMLIQAQIPIFCYRDSLAMELKHSARVFEDSANISEHYFKKYLVPNLAAELCREADGDVVPMVSWASNSGS